MTKLHGATAGSAKVLARLSGAGRSTLIARHAGALGTRALLAAPSLVGPLLRRGNGRRTSLFFAYRALAIVIALVVGSPVSAQERGVHADVAIDARVLLRRAEQGDAKAAWLLGTRYSSGRAGVRDDSEAFRWFRRSANLGLAEAQYNLGIMYQMGRGVEASPTDAVKWFKAAARQGLPQAQYNLAALYSEGRGVGRDLALAAKWMRSAAESGLPAAQYNLAVFYEHGAGVPKDKASALRWYRAARDAGFARAAARIKTLDGAELQTATATSNSPRAKGPPKGAGKAGGRTVQRIEARIASDPSATVASAPRQEAALAVPKPRTRSEPSARPKATRPVGAASSGAHPLADITVVPEKSLTIQLGSYAKEMTAARVITTHGIEARAKVFPVIVKGARRYSVVYGVFGGRAKAVAAVSVLPTPLREKVWIRSVGSLRSVLAQ